MSSKRRFRRFPARGYVAHVFGQRIDVGLGVENLSLGGVFVRCSAPMPVGTAVSVELLSQGKKPGLRVSGLVVGVVSPVEAHASGRVPGMGIEFDARHAEPLRELLTHLASGSPLDGDLPEPPRIAPVTLAKLPKRAVAEMPRPSSPSRMTFEARVHVAEVEEGQLPRRKPSLPTMPLPPVSAPRAPRASAPMSGPRDSNADSARLQVQVKGLLMELAEWQLKADLLERENQRLRDRLGALGGLE